MLGYVTRKGCQFESDKDTKNKYRFILKGESRSGKSVNST
jgi:hypothetical protein